MGLLHEIQETLVSDNSEIGPILLKLRLLSSRLGSVQLEDWVKHESEGYPEGIPVPEYRRLSVSYTATFSGFGGQGVKNAPIPPALIAAYAGKQWLNLELRQSVSSIDEMMGDKSERTVKLNRSDLILALQDKVYEDLACNAVVGHVSRAALSEIKNSVKAKVLELTIALEKSVPTAAQIVLGPIDEIPKVKEAEKVSSITNQIVHGNITTINNSGNHASVNLTQGNVGTVEKTLTEAGLNQDDAKAFALILQSENPQNGEPIGPRASKWIVDNIKKAASGAWNMGVSTATAVLAEAAKKYYGL